MGFRSLISLHSSMLTSLRKNSLSVSILFLLSAEYRVSPSSRWRPYMGWLGPSILTATEGWPFLHTAICLWSRSMEVLLLR